MRALTYGYAVYAMYARSNLLFHGGRLAKGYHTTTLGRRKLPAPSKSHPNTQYDVGESNIFRQSYNPVCGFSMMKQVRLCTVWPTENWIASSLNHIQGWMTVPKILLSLSSYWVFGVTMTRCFFQSLITEKKSNEERVSRPGHKS